MRGEVWFLRVSLAQLNERVMVFRRCVYGAFAMCLTSLFSAGILEGNLDAAGIKPPPLEKGTPMYTKNAGYIRGLGIATIALSAVALLTCLFCLVVGGVTAAALGDGYLAHELSAYDHHYGYGYGAQEVVNLTLIILAIIVIWEILSGIVSLVAGIIALRQGNNPAKYGSIFAWSIAGAVASLLGGRLISMGVLIVAAALAGKEKNARDTAQWQQNNPVVTQPGYCQATVSQDPFYTNVTSGNAAQPQQAQQAGEGASTQTAGTQAGVEVPFTHAPVQAQAQVQPQGYPQPTQAYQQTYCQPAVPTAAQPAPQTAPAAEPAAPATEPAVPASSPAAAPAETDKPAS